MKKILRYALLIIIAVSVSIIATKYMNKDITENDVSLETSYALSKDPAVTIIDVRTQAEMDKGHIPNAINLDITKPEFKEEIKKLDPNKNYLIYCNVGRKSAKAVQAMKNVGFKNIYHMKDGIQKWTNAGLPTNISIDASYLLSKDPNITIIDVRTKEEVNTGHITNAINLDITKPEFEEEIKKLDKNKEYLVYCQEGDKSAEAVQKMKDAGFKHIYYMKGGMQKWKEKSLPINKAL